MCETAGHDYGIDIADRAITVPQRGGVATQRANGLDHIEFAVGPREDDDSDAGRHQTAAPTGAATMSITASSITGLVRNRVHMSSTSARALPSSGDSTTKRMLLPTRTSLTPAKPNAGNERSMVAPCGSAMPVRRRTSTCTANNMPASLTVRGVRARPLGKGSVGDPFVRIDVTAAQH